MENQNPVKRAQLKENWKAGKVHTLSICADVEVACTSQSQLVWPGTLIAVWANSEACDGKMFLAATVWQVCTVYLLTR